MSSRPLPIALQLYTLREMEATPEEVLATVAKAGYSYVETIHQTELSGQSWKERLDNHGLSAVCSHVPTEAFVEDLDGTIQQYKDLGTEFAAIPIPNRKLWAGEPTGADWQTFGRQLEEIGAACHSAGLSLLYHSHWQEMEEYDGKLAIDLLLAETDPNHVGYEPDFAWITKGGQNPVDILQRYAGRCPCVHMKDLAAPGQNEDHMGLEDVGYGILNWEEIIPQAKTSGAQWYIVEHDMPNGHVNSITRSYNFIAAQMQA